MYISGWVLSVPEEKRDRYTEVAEKFWAIAKDCGATEQVEGWEDEVPDGTQTDFRRAVAAKPGEKIVFAWMVWPDKATCDASHERMMTDPRMKELEADMPFDGKRMIFGGFTALFIKGR